MAAPIQTLVKSNLLTIYARRATRLLIHRPAATCTYVVLPEVPPDTADTNTLMDVNSMPDWTQITPSSVYRACGKLAILYETKLADHCEKLKDLGEPVTFEGIFEPLEEVSVPLQHAYKCVKHLSTVKKKTFADAYEGIYKPVHRSRAERWQKEMLYLKIKELNANSNTLTEAQQSLVAKYLREAKQSGVELTGEEKLIYDSNWRELVLCQDQFRRSVYFSSKMFEYTVYDEGDLGEMPQHIRNRLSVNRDAPDEGPWRYSIESATSYRPALTFCPNRNLRKHVWVNLVQIASVKFTPEGHNNKRNIEQIRDRRRDMSKLVGYNSYAEMVMDHRMAGSVQNVMEFIETLRSAFQPEAEEEVSTLQRFASSHGFNEKIEMWDLDYWSAKQKRELYSACNANLSEYFPLPRVLDGLFQICEGLFGVKIKRKERGAVPVWHPTVEVFDLFDEDGTEKGTFYIDPYTRFGEKYGGSWLDTGRERSCLYQGNPLTYLNLNINPSIGSQPALMSIREVGELFAMMGHTLQQLLTTVEYSEVAGQNNIEWDALHVSSMFLSMWLMRPDTLISLAGHWDTNQPLSSEQVQDIIGAHNHMSSNYLMQNLFSSVYDLEIHFSERHFDTAIRHLWPRYILQNLDKHYLGAFSMVDVFADPKQAAGKYGGLWATMVAADVMKSFNECSNTEELQATGRRFKNTILSLGGSLPAGEVFRRFKGHDPSVDSMIQLRLPHQHSQQQQTAK